MSARILIVEDNQANLDLMFYLLKSFGYVPSIARDGETGVRMARSDLPDLILCDVQLPCLDGYGVARSLKSDDAVKTIPLIAVTALAMVGDRDKLLAAGFDGYMGKPIDPETFVGQVETYLPMSLRSFSSGYPFGPTTSNSPVSERGMRRGTILVVDDAPTNLELMRSILEPSGYTILLASGVDDALRIVNDHPVDLIVSDLHMPAKNGTELIRSIRASPQFNHVKILVHSATVMSPRDAAECYALGANRFVARPLEPQVLLAEISELL